MSEDFDLLLDELEDSCRSRGVNLHQYCLIRTPWDQARFWRQSRRRDEVLSAVSRLEDAGADFLAGCLMDVGPQPMGPRITNSLPGLSWHQWGEAADYCPVGSDGKLDWDDEAGFHSLAEEARRLKLTSGYYWRFKDMPHVQLRSQGVQQVYLLKEIDDAMRDRFGAKRPVQIRH